MSDFDDQNEVVQDNIPVSSQDSQDPKNKNLNFVQKIFEFITGINSEERIKQRKLREIKKELKNLKFKFYNTKKDIINPAFGHYLYEIYRMSQNFVKYFDVKVHAKSIKEFILDFMLSEEQIKMKDYLNSQNIVNLIKESNDVKKTVEEIRTTMQNYVKSFNPEQVRKINATYNQISDLANLTNFDWFSILHKFDSSIFEGNFEYKPTFEALDGKYLVDELVNINDYLLTIDLNRDWKYIIDYVNKVADLPGLDNVLKKLIQIFRVLKRDDYFSKIICIILKDPYFKSKKFSSNSKIVQDYIYNFQLEIQKNVEDSLKTLKRNKINKLLNEIFHTTAIVRLKNYSPKINELLSKKNIKGVQYVEPMNYLKAFLLDFCKGEIKPKIDFFIIKGAWESSASSSEFSKILDNINLISDSIISFDNKCADDSSYGKELRRLSFAIKHDPNAANLVRKLVIKIDSEAYQIILDSVKFFIDVANSIKLLLDEYAAKKPKIIINLQQIKWDFPGSPDTELSLIYKKLFNFVSLLKNYIKK